MVVQTRNYITQEVGAGELGIQGPCDLPSEFQTSLGYTARPCLPKPEVLEQTDLWVTALYYGLSAMRTPNGHKLKFPNSYISENKRPMFHYLYVTGIYILAEIRYTYESGTLVTP